MNKPTLIEAVNHLREHYGISQADVLNLLRTPMHPRDLRDDFAKAAITGTLPGAAVGNDRTKEYAEWAYKMADAMLEVRNANR